MPFDGQGFDFGSVPPRSPPRGESVAAILVMILAALLLMTPLSPVSCSDIAHYVRGH